MLLLLISLAAWSAPPAEPDLDRILSEARAASRAGDPATEQARCTQLVDLAPTSVGAARCAGRLSWLAARRDPDGGFSGLAALEGVRRRWASDPRPEDREQVVELATGLDTPDALRIDALQWLARERLRARDPVGAQQWTSKLWEGSDEAGRREAGALHAQALAAAGRVDEARAIEEAAGITSYAGRQEGVDMAVRTARRQSARQTLSALLLVWLLGTAPLSLRGWWARPRPRPTGLLALGLVGLGALGLAGAWEPATRPGMSALILSQGLLYLHAAGLLPGLRRARGLARLGALFASLAGSWLVLDRFDLLSWLPAWAGG